MLSSKSQEGAKPAGLIYIVMYTDDRQKVAAAFTHRQMADDFCRSRSANSLEANCSIIETVVDGNTGGPMRD